MHGLALAGERLKPLVMSQARDQRRGQVECIAPEFESDDLIVLRVVNELLRFEIGDAGAADRWWTEIVSRREK